MMFGESDWRIIMTKRKPHRNAKAIKTWADGADVQFKTFCTWKDYDNSKGLPDFDFGEWRVKPEAIVVENCIWLDVSCNETRVSVSGNPNARFTFDADTKKLIKAVVIK